MTYRRVLTLTLIDVAGVGHHGFHVMMRGFPFYER
jgi:hypothetical protein